jgi:hypothetical protein
MLLEADQKRLRGAAIAGQAYQLGDPQRFGARSRTKLGVGGDAALHQACDARVVAGQCA